MKKIILLISVFWLINLFALAQISESDTAKIDIRLASTLNQQTGNVRVLASRNRFDFLYAPFKNIVFKTQNTYLYQENRGVKVDDAFLSRNFIYFNPHRKVYPFIRFYFAENFRLAIDFRYMIGGGLSWQLLQRKNHLIKLSGSAVYEETDFSKNTFNDKTYNGSDRIKVFREIFRLFGRHTFGKNKFVFHYDIYYQPCFSAMNNYRYLADIGLDIPMWKGLNFTSNFLYSYENVVVSNILQQDTILTFGLSYQLRKN